MSATTLASLILAGSALAAHDRAAVDAMVLSMYQPYTRGGSAGAVWDQPIFSSEVTSLIARWKSVQPKDEPDDLNDGDWLCQCQDYDAAKFRVTIGAHRRLNANAAQVQLAIDLGDGRPRNVRMIFNREARSWKLDNLYARGGFESGLKVALRRTIAADMRLPRR